MSHICSPAMWSRYEHCERCGYAINSERESVIGFDAVNAVALDGETPLKMVLEDNGALELSGTWFDERI